MSRMDEWTEERTNGWTDGWIDGMNMYCVIRNIGIVGVGVGEFFVFGSNST